MVSKYEATILRTDAASFDAFATGLYDGKTYYFGTRTGSSDASLCPAAIPGVKDMDMLLRAI
jgi:hypothetical protein